MSIDIEHDDDAYNLSPLARKAKCSTLSDSHTQAELSEQDIVLDEMNMLLPNALNEMKQYGHLETWLNLSRIVNDSSFPFENIDFLLLWMLAFLIQCEA